MQRVQANLSTVAVKLPAPKASGETLQIAERLRQLISSWVHITRDQAGTPTSSQVATLGLLDRDGPTSTAGLAQRRGVKHQSMRLIVAQLDADGTVHKAVDPDDRRNQIVSITPKGHALLRKEQLARAQWIAQILPQASQPEDLREVSAAIEVLERVLSRSNLRSV